MSYDNNSPELAEGLELHNMSATERDAFRSGFLYARRDVTHKEDSIKVLRVNGLQIAATDDNGDLVLIISRDNDFSMAVTQGLWPDIDDDSWEARQEAFDATVLGLAQPRWMKGEG